MQLRSIWQLKQVFYTHIQSAGEFQGKDRRRYEDAIFDRVDRFPADVDQLSKLCLCQTCLLAMLLQMGL